MIIDNQILNAAWMLIIYQDFEKSHVHVYACKAHYIITLQRYTNAKLAKKP
jgi:hypothetical protein